jgi:hypothetical protein
MTYFYDLPEGCTWSAQEWDKWVTERVNDRATIFSTEPDEMVSAYNREIGYTHDYHGRELLELLQNADDEGMEDSRSRKAIIVLSEDGLCFANTGKPFSAAGIKSLMISDNSPKKYSGVRYIGNRGLGFRSVLSWTDCPFILSGNLSIGFDKTRAKNWLRQLARDNERVKRKIEDINEKTGNSEIIPVPTLAVPAILDHLRSQDFLPSAPAFGKVWTVAKELRTQGYDTIIALPFTHPTAFTEAQEQLALAGREVILFLRNINELIIRLPSKETVWTAIGPTPSVTISSTDSQEPTQTWGIHTHKGTIPSNLLEADQKDTNEYEIRLAIPPIGIEVPKVLFSYFPTLVRFPFPLIAHVTLELTNNRQNLIDSAANAYLLQELARFIAEVAENKASESPISDISSSDIDPWYPLSLLTPTGDLDLVIQKLKFNEALIKAAQQRELIPVRDGRKLKAAEAMRLTVGNAEWLPDVGFEDVMKPTDDPQILKMVEVLDTPQLSDTELRNRLNRAAPFLSISARATLIAELIKSKTMPNPPPNLLIDSKGDLIVADTLTFVPPVDGVTFDLPAWMTLRLLDNELATALRKAFGGITSQDLISRLPGFGLRPYSLASLASAINARINEIVTEQCDRESEYRLEGLKTLFLLYSQSDEDSIPKRSDDLKVHILNRQRTFVPADTLYFGAEYIGTDLTEILYGPLFPEKIVSAPSDLHLDANTEKVKGFLYWLGVASKPRLQKIPLQNREFKKYVYAQLTFPATFGDYTILSASEISAAQFTDVSWIEGLDEIIKSADPHAIVAWLALDERFEKWRVNGDSQAKLKFRKSQAWYDRTMTGQTVPSYIIWRLQRDAWLPVFDGSKRAPVTCTLATNMPDDVKAILPRPALNELDECFNLLKIDRRAIRFALERVGVNASLDDLSWDDFYTLLLRLPQLDQEGRYARAVYRALVARGGNEESAFGTMHEKFLQEGKLWSRQKGVTAYYPVKAGIYYADDATVPQVITREMCMFELDRRKGAQKVYRLFGAKPLSYRDIEVEIKNVNEHPRANHLNAEVERLKPYIYALRIYSDTNAQGLRRLRDLTVKICKGATGLVLIGNEIYDFSLNEGDMILSGKDAYLCSTIESVNLLLEDAIIAHDVGEILARLLGIENSGDLTALAQCPLSRRLALLQRMLGVDPEPFLNEALLKLNVEPEPDVYNAERFLPPVPTTSQEVSTPITKPTGTQSPGTLYSTKSKNQIEQVDVKRVQHIPSPPAKQIGQRVRATPCTGSFIINSREVTDAKRCQDLAYSFEEANGQDRYPLRVDHLQGSEYFGCDLLSFATPEDRDKFESTLDEKLILRFIEVKGRSSEKGTITLGGNELTAAFKRLDRFYIYRVFEVGIGKFEVVILNDPTSNNPKVIYEIDLFRETRTTRYEVVTYSN